MRRREKDDVPPDALYFAVKVLDPAVTFIRNVAPRRNPWLVESDSAEMARSSVADSVVAPDTLNPMKETPPAVSDDRAQKTPTSTREPVVNVTAGPDVDRFVYEADDVDSDVPTVAPADDMMASTSSLIA